MDFSNTILLLSIALLLQTTAITTSQTRRQLSQMGQGLTVVPEGTPHVKTLNLAYNHLTHLPDQIFHNKSYRLLHKIELCHNKIKNISETSFSQLNHLKIVDLSDNNLTSIPSASFSSNSKLEKVILSGNRLSFHPTSIFLLSSSLEILVLSHNKIEQIFEFNFMGVPNLKHLVLDHNIIVSVSPRSFKTTPDLQFLSMANTAISSLTKNMFGASLPRILDLTETPLACRFDPPLKKVKNEAVTKLINFNDYLLGESDRF